MIPTIPDIAALADTFLGQPYSQGDCWDFVRQLFVQGFGLDLARDTEQAATVFQEVWYRGDAADPLTLAQPWDLVIIANHAALPVSDHVGVALDQQRFVHARRSDTGVAVARLRPWQSRLLQLARLRELL